MNLVCSFPSEGQGRHRFLDPARSGQHAIQTTDPSFHGPERLPGLQKRTWMRLLEGWAKHGVGEKQKFHTHLISISHRMS